MGFLRFAYFSAPAAYSLQKVKTMTCRRKKLLLIFVAAVISGTLLHFLYDWVPCTLTALFSPINESLWEHVKIICWPYLLGSFCLAREDSGALGPRLLTLPVLCVLMLLLGWIYHITLGLDQLWVDIALYILLMLAGVLLPEHFRLPKSRFWQTAPFLIMGILILATFVFTFHPPELLLFRDLSRP